MKVLKFGGTSVGSAESILNVKKIVESQTEPVIVVVSALGGITDKLIQTAQMALEGDLRYQKVFLEIVGRHEKVIREVLPAGSARGELLTIVRAPDPLDSYPCFATYYETALTY